MCTKHVMLGPMKQSLDSAMQKSCKPGMLGRIWNASRRALKLEHMPTQHFACCQWQTGPKPSNLYLFYRWLLFITVTSICISSFACQKIPSWYKGPAKLNYYKWFIYFTNWGYLMIVVQSALALLVVHKYRGANSYSLPCESNGFGTPLLCRAYWLAHNIATDLALVITLMYWSAVYNSERHEINAMNLLVHGGNSLIMLIEIAVTMHPIKAAHALYGAGAGLAYGVFSGLYYLADGKDRTDESYIYAPLDWKQPGTAIGFVTLCAVVMVLAHAFATLLAAARTHIARRLRIGNPHSDCLTLPPH